MASTKVRSQAGVLRVSGSPLSGCSLSVYTLISISPSLSFAFPVFGSPDLWLHPQVTLFYPLAQLGWAGARGRSLKLQTGFLVAGSRLGLNMGESQLVVGIQVYGPSWLGRRTGGFGPTTSWKRETCPDCFSRPHIWVQARSPTTSAFLEVRQPAQS